MARRATIKAQPEPEIESAGYDTMTVAELTEIIDQASAARESKMADERKAFVEETRRRAAMLGVDVNFGSTKGTKAEGERARKPAAVKYAGPDGETWSGRGRLPNWLSAAEASGRNREEFAVKSDD